MGTRVAQNNRDVNNEMLEKFNIKTHVKKLTKECLKAFECNPNLKPNFEGQNCGVGQPERALIPKDEVEELKGEASLTDLRTSASQEPIDGVDSGVEVIRASSSNGSNSDRYTPAQSCGSSLLSCYSEFEGDRGSECGSENSKEGKTKVNAQSRIPGESKTVSIIARNERSRISSRRVSDKDKDLSESCSENSSTCEPHNVNHPNRISDVNRTVSSRLPSKKSEGKTPTTRRCDHNSRVSSLDKSVVRSHSTVRTGSSAGERLKMNCRPTKPLHMASGCKMDDGRWPTAVHKTDNRRNPHVNDCVKKMSNVMSCSVSSSNSMTSSFNGKSLVGEVKSNALDKYGTLPRRPKHKSLENTGEGLNNQTLSLVRSSSVSREPSLNRAATLRRQQSREKEKESNLANGKSLPPYPKSRKGIGKTVIYHEISIQTSVTGEDITNILAGVPQLDSVITPVVEKASRAVQSEGREKLKEMEECYSKQCEELEIEKKENKRLKQERQDMLLRISKMLGYAELKDNTNGEYELSELEQHFQAVGLTVIKQREELSELRHFKGIMQRDLEKSFAAQKNLLQQQQDIEAEYFELQEFLQAEKTALSESLNDTEAELEKLRNQLLRKEEHLQRQQEECKHLVRICEQRRQENLSLEAKLSGLEQRSRDVIVQQGAAVSGAAVALSGLGARLDTLVEQLATSCNISEKDLEDVIYHNEVYAQGQSADHSPDESSPRRGIGKDRDSPRKATSFLNAIMGALRSATQSPIATGKNSLSYSHNDHSDPLSLLEPENDPDLEIEENASSESNYTECVCSSRGELAKYDICEDTITLVPNGDHESDVIRSDSIQSLSAAILARQEIEKIERNLSPDLIVPTEVNSLLDKVIDVDNLLTKLLKVLRIIQQENDVSMEQLEDQRLDLTEKLQQEQMCKKKMEARLQKLQGELKDARSQLSVRIVQLEQAKLLLNKDARISDTQRHFTAIHNAIGTLQSIQDVVDQCPPLAKLQQDLEDCTQVCMSGDDLNANTAANGNFNTTVVKEVKRNGSVLSTAV